MADEVRLIDANALKERLKKLKAKKDDGHALDIFYFNAGSPISNVITHWQYLPEPPKED